MQPLEKFEMMDDSQEETRDPMAQLSFAYKRSEAALEGGMQEALSEGIRRAEAILFAAGEPLSAHQSVPPYPPVPSRVSASVSSPCPAIRQRPWTGRPGQPG